MVYFISQFFEFATGGLSEEQIEAIKSDNGEVVVVPDRTDDNAPKDTLSREILKLLGASAKCFREAGFSCTLSVSLDEFFCLASGEEFDKKAKALADLGFGLQIMPVCLSDITLAETLTDEQCDTFKVATDVCRGAGIDCTFDEQCFSVEQTLSASRKLNAWRHEIENANVNGIPLSPFEKFMYTYDIVSQFRYKDADEGEDLSVSRKLISVLGSDKIVCTGFAALFVHILGTLGIACEVLNLEETKESKGHSTCIVYIKDDKYGFDGFFISDPTFGTPNDERDQNVYFAVIPLSSAKEVYGSFSELDDLDWMKIMLYERVCGGAPQLSYKPTIDEMEEYFRKSEEYCRLKTEIVTREPDVDLDSVFTDALINVAISKGMTEAQAQTFAASRIHARYDGMS